MKNIKLLIPVLAWVIMLMSSTMAFAYSPVGGSYKSDYVNGDPESPYKAEVVLEHLFENNGKSVAKPIQWIEEPALTGKIVARAYFTEVPEDFSDAVFMVVAYKNDTVKYIATSPIDVSSLTSSVELVIKDSVSAEEPVPENERPDMICAHVWDSLDTVMPLTELKSITEKSCAIQSVAIDSYDVEFECDNGLGIVDFDVEQLSDTVDLSDCTLTVSVDEGVTFRNMYLDDGTKADTESDKFVFTDVDMTDGESLVIKDYSNDADIRYIINEPVFCELNPDKYTIKSSNVEINPDIGTEERLVDSSFEFYNDNNIKIADFYNKNFTDEEIANSYEHIYWSIYNEEGNKYLRMYNDGIERETGGFSDIYYGLFRFFGNTYSGISGSYVVDLRFKVKEVNNKHEDALDYTNTENEGKDLLPQFHFWIRGGGDNSSTTELLNLRSSVYSVLKPDNGNELYPDLISGSIKEDVDYRIRIYARRLADGTTSYTYYTSCANENNGSFIHWIDSDDFNNQNINWIDDVKVKQIRLGITQRGGYAHDLYIDYIKFMES